MCDFFIICFVCWCCNTNASVICEIKITYWVTVHTTVRHNVFNSAQILWSRLANAIRWMFRRQESSCATKGRHQVSYIRSVVTVRCIACNCDKCWDISVIYHTSDLCQWLHTSLLPLCVSQTKDCGEILMVVLRNNRRWPRDLTALKVVTCAWLRL